MEQTTNNFSIPGAIIVAGALIAGALYFGLSASHNTVSGVYDEQPTGDLNAVAEVTDADHVLGNPNAPVTIIEYSDFECPFCKVFHETMQQVIKDKGTEVAWVYRHFPLDSIHSQARTEAIASECAAEQGGNEAFWKYANRFFEVTPSNNQTNIAVVLPQIAREIGLNEDLFMQCLSSGKYDDHIQQNLENGIATGGNGTPWSIVVGENGNVYPLSGAQPYEAIVQLIELAQEEN